MNNAFLGLLVFIAALFAGRWINERAIRKLGKDQSTKLVQGLSRYRMASLAGVILFVAGYFIFRSTIEKSGVEPFTVFAVILLVYMLAGTAFVFVKLKRMKIDENYISSYLLSTAVQYLGLISYFGLAGSR
ncbi:MAG: hypothetical protein OEM82_05235 [Acidobacteriota bacterium]|nr:hypothetical protein [Acidobacteriota bacterium]MDH3530316.1 hypothetical protein [Acidobacteriota bacterium]